MTLSAKWSLKNPKTQTVLIGIAAVLLIAFPWFLSSGYLFFTDFVWGPRPPLEWQTNGGPALAVVKLLGIILSQSLAEKLFVTGILFLLYFSGVWMARALSDDEHIAALIGLFMLCNPFVYDRLGYGQLFMLLGLAFLGFGVAAMLRRLTKGEGARSILAMGAWFGLALQFLPHALFFAGVLGALWLFVEWTQRGRAMRKIALPVLAASAIALALNLNWLTASHSTVSRASTFGLAQLEAFQTSGKTGGEALRNVLMLSGFWGKDQYRYFDLTTIPGSWGRSFLLLLPVLAVGAWAGLREQKRRALTGGMLVAGALAAALAVGIRLPATKALTLWLVAHLPFYSGMRETQKWDVVLVLAYAYLLAVGFIWLSKQRFVVTNRTALFAFLCGVMLMQAPKLYAGMGGVTVPHEYPADWAQANDTLVRQGCEGDTVLLPWHLYMHYEWAKSVIASPANLYFSCPVLTGKNMEWGGIADDSGNPRGAIVADWIQHKGTDDSLRGPTVNASTIILMKEADWKQYAWLDTLPNLHVIQDTPTMRVYAQQAR